MEQFQLNSNPVVAREDAGVVKKEFVKIYPTSNRTGTAFTSNVDFEFENSGKQYFCPAQSYIQLRLQFYGQTGSGTYVLLNDASGIFLTWNAGAAFWATYSHQLNNTVVDRADQFTSQDNCAKRLLDSVVIRDTYGTVSCLETNRVTRLYNSGFDGSGYSFGNGVGAGTNDIIYRPSLGLFATTDLIPPSARHLISFQVDTNWQRKIIESTVQNYTPNSNNSYYVQVQDIIFYAAMLSADMPPANGPHFINFGASECQFQAVTSTTNNLFFNVKPSSNKLTTFIQSSLVGSNTLNPAGYMDASGGFSSTMTLFPRIQFGSVVLPQPDINLYNTNIGTTTGDWSYWKDAYYQTIQANGWSTDELGPESFPTWLMLGPLFSNKFDRDPSDQSTTVMVYCTFSTTPTNVNLWLFSQYERSLCLQYSNGRCVNVTVEDI